MIGGQVVEYGQEDAYGHRKLGGIGMFVGEALKGLTGIDIVNQQLAYLMRAGAPDSLDRMVATSFGSLAVQEIELQLFPLNAITSNVIENKPDLLFA